MPSFQNDAVEIAYLDEGEGEPIVLVHGFASTKNVNWVYPTWVSELKRGGRRVVALDNRGHGESAKLYDPGQYTIPIMAGDVIALMDHGLFAGIAHDGAACIERAGAVALGDLWRHRHGHDRRRRSR
jgi:pimeloyl-ACP methyl ester carboxylesterase